MLLAGGLPLLPEFAPGVVIRIAALSEFCIDNGRSRFRSYKLHTLHWAYFLPVGFALLIGIYLAADISSSRPENCSTLKLRSMIFVFGLGFLYLGCLAWYFDLEFSRLRSEYGKLHRIVFIGIGVILMLTAALRSRAGLIKDSDYFTKAPYDIEIGGKPDISPAERVNRIRRSTDPKKVPGRESETGGC